MIKNNPLLNYSINCLKCQFDLDVEFEFYHIAVLHDVGFAFGTELAGGFDGLFGAELFEIIEITNTGCDEAALEVGMDGAGGFGGGGTLLDGPGAAFFLAGGEERLET